MSNRHPWRPCCIFWPLLQYTELSQVSFPLEGVEGEGAESGDFPSLRLHGYLGI